MKIMKSLNNGFIADVFSTKELKEMQAEITRVLKEREEEREKAMRQYQEELDDLLNAIQGDGFFVSMPDFPSQRFAVMDWEDD